jgi:hypothetical protein
MAGHGATDPTAGPARRGWKDLKFRAARICYESKDARNKLCECQFTELFQGVLESFCVSENPAQEWLGLGVGEPARDGRCGRRFSKFEVIVRFGKQVSTRRTSTRLSLSDMSWSTTLEAVPRRGWTVSFFWRAQLFRREARGVTAMEPFTSDGRQGGVRVGAAAHGGAWRKVEPSLCACGPEQRARSGCDEKELLVRELLHLRSVLKMGRSILAGDACCPALRPLTERGRPCTSECVDASVHGCTSCSIQDVETTTGEVLSAADAGAHGVVG